MTRNRPVRGAVLLLTGALALGCLPVRPFFTVATALTRSARVSPRAPRAVPATALALADAAVARHGLAFVETGWRPEARADFALRGRNVSAYFGCSGVTFTLKRDPAVASASAASATVTLDFEGASAAVRPRGEQPTGTLVSYFEGARDRWRAGLRSYESLVYSELWPGIDLTFRAAGERLKYEFIVRPGADPSAIGLRVGGADRLAVDERGELAIVTQAGTLRDEAPVAFQERGGQQAKVEVAYAIGEDGRRVGFRIGEYDRTLPLVVDPAVLIYAGFLGGAGTDYALDVAVDESGGVYVVGGTYSSQAEGFPATGGPDLTFNPTGPAAPPPACDTQDAFLDAFVAKLRPDGSGFAYLGYIGGSCNQVATSVAVGADGSAYVTGYTTSDQRTFPVRGGPRLTYGGGGYEGDAFVAKLSPNGTEIVYAGYIGGSGDDIGFGVAVDAQGSAYVVGSTESGNFPVVAGPQRTRGSASGDAFVAKVRADGAGLVYSGYVGGSGEDRGAGIAVDGDGSAHITGVTLSATGLPVSSGPSLAYGGGVGDAFVAKVKPDGTGYVYLGYLGGEGSDTGVAIALDAAGSAYVVGMTSSEESTFPVLRGPDVTFNDADPARGFDAYVAKVKGDGTGLVYAGYIGGMADDGATGVAVLADGSAVVGGMTASAASSFPTADAIDATYGGGPDLGDGFVAVVGPDGTSLVLSTYVGGSAGDGVTAVAADASGAIYATGLTGSSEASFPVAGGPVLAHGGAFDAFVAKISSGPPGPVVTGATKVGKKLVVTGDNFAPRAVVLVNGTSYKTKADRTTPDRTLKSGKAGKVVMAGDIITVRNPDGATSNAVRFPL